MSEGTEIKTIEQRALEILETYSGANNYILKMQTQMRVNSKFYPTRAQSDYITSFFDHSLILLFHREASYVHCDNNAQVAL